jgi:hypothetical protein
LPFPFPFPLPFPLPWSAGEVIGLGLGDSDGDGDVGGGVVAYPTEGDVKYSTGMSCVAKSMKSCQMGAASTPP